MEELNKTKLRECKMANGEIVKLTEDEFNNVVEAFKMLSKWDREILLEAVNGAKIKLLPLNPEKVAEHIRKKVFIAVHVKEEIQTKHWDFYYKLEAVTIESYNKKKNLIAIKDIRGQVLEIEPRSLFLEQPATE